eukprot:Rmarinus@m.3341
MHQAPFSKLPVTRQTPWSLWLTAPPCTCVRCTRSMILSASETMGLEGRGKRGPLAGATMSAVTMPGGTTSARPLRSQSLRSRLPGLLCVWLFPAQLLFPARTVTTTCVRTRYTGRAAQTSHLLCACVARLASPHQASRSWQQLLRRPRHRPCPCAATLKEVTSVEVEMVMVAMVVTVVVVVMLLLRLLLLPMLPLQVLVMVAVRTVALKTGRLVACPFAARVAAVVMMMVLVMTTATTMMMMMMMTTTTMRLGSGSVARGVPEGRPLACLSRQ